jgi:hypothetical protein
MFAGRLSCQRLLVGILLILLLPIGPARAEEPNELFTGLKGHELLEKADLRSLHRPAVTSGGVQFGMISGQRKPEITSVVLAVHGSVDEAKRTLQYLRRTSSAARPRADDPSAADLGDERYSWRAADTWRAFAFRRRNVTVFLSGVGKVDDALQLGRQIDKLIQNNREIAPLGHFAETPQFVGLGLPQTVDADKPYDASPDVRGLGPLEKVLLLVEHGGPISDMRDGKLFVRCPPKLVEGDGKFIEQSGVVRVRAVAANEDCVFVVREFDIDVVKQP